MKNSFFAISHLDAEKNCLHDRPRSLIIYFLHQTVHVQSSRKEFSLLSSFCFFRVALDAISALFYLHKSTIDFIKFESEKRRTKVIKPTKKNPQSSRHTIHFRKKLLFARRFFPLFQGERKLLRRRKSVFTFVPAEPHTEWS